MVWQWFSLATRLGSLCGQQTTSIAPAYQTPIAGAAFRAACDGGGECVFSSAAELLRPSQLRRTWEFDGGALMNQASHYVDLLDWLVGPVESVSASIATLGQIH